jgi:acetolactate synthase-1/2/3 large subunit
LIFNDSNFGLIKWKQEEKFGKSEFINFTNPNFEALAKSIGLKGYTIHKSDELIPALKDAFEQKVPCVIDCRVDYTENLKLKYRIKDV